MSHLFHIINLLLKVSCNLTENFWIVLYVMRLIFVVVTINFKSKPRIHDVRILYENELHIWNYDSIPKSSWFDLMLLHNIEVLFIFSLITNLSQCFLLSLTYLLPCYAKPLQSCPTLRDPTDCSPSGSPIPGSLWARTLEWVAISVSNAWNWKVKVKSMSRVRLLATTWTWAYQAPPAMGFSRQEYWSGVPLPSPTYLLGQLKWFILCLVFLKRLWVLGLPCLSISVFVPCLCLKAGMIISFLLFTTVLSVPLTLNKLQ